MRSPIATLALGMALLSSCAIYVTDEIDVPPPPPRGDLAVFWTFEGFGDCADVDDVWVTLVDPDGFIYDDARYPCEFGGVEYDRLDEGFWTVELTGIDFSNRINFRAGEHGVHVIGDANNEYTFDLGVVR